MDVDLLGVLLGGLLGVGGTVGGQMLSNAAQKESRRRAEILPVAGRALNAAQESWDMLHAHAVWSARGGESAAGMTSADYLVKYTEAYQRLTLALDELVVLVRGIRPEADALRDNLKVGTLLPGDDHEQNQKAFEASRNRLLKLVQHVLDVGR